MVVRRRRFEYVRELDLLLGDGRGAPHADELLPGDEVRRSRDESDAGGAGDSADPYNTESAEHDRSSRDQRARGLTPEDCVPSASQITAPRFRDDMALIRRGGVGTDEPVAARRPRLRAVPILGAKVVAETSRNFATKSTNGFGSSPSSSASSFRRIATFATSAPVTAPVPAGTATARDHERQIEAPMVLPEDAVRDHAAAEVRRPDAVAGIAMSVVDVPAAERPERGQMVTGDVDRTAPRGLDRYLDEPRGTSDGGRRSRSGSPRGRTRTAARCRRARFGCIPPRPKEILPSGVVRT